MLSGAGKFCLAHGLRQLTGDTKSDVNCLQTLHTRRNESPNDVRCWPSYNVNCKYSSENFDFSENS